MILRCPKEKLLNKLKHSSALSFQLFFIKFQERSSSRKWHFNFSICHEFPTYKHAPSYFSQYISTIWKLSISASFLWFSDDKKNTCLHFQAENRLNKNKSQNHKQEQIYASHNDNNYAKNEVHKLDCNWPIWHLSLKRRKISVSWTVL